VSHFEYAMAQNSDRIITVSYAMQQDLIKQGWSPSKVKVVWNDVDSERYDMAKCDLKDIAAIRERYGVPKALEHASVRWKAFLGEGG
jgi:glycosyltransferase involved in cell wall biosynthesis